MKRTKSNTNTNENNNYYSSTGFKSDFIEYNKINNENRRQLLEEEVIIFTKKSIYFNKFLVKKTFSLINKSAFTVSCKCRRKFYLIFYC